MLIFNEKVSILAFVGFLFIIMDGKATAQQQLSFSNAWTLPQDGFTVFYRFFRDKISWYEADAVCQFHHANLVTVDNGVKYDASRAFLSDLNITENIWIGLMRPENSDRFLWSNSRILDREFGYWAEQIPVIDSPLCAVIDRRSILGSSGFSVKLFDNNGPVNLFVIDDFYNNGAVNLFVIDDFYNNGPVNLFVIDGFYNNGPVNLFVIDDFYNKRIKGCRPPTFF